MRETQTEHQSFVFYHEKASSPVQIVVVCLNQRPNIGDSVSVGTFQSDVNELHVEHQVQQLNR